MGWIYRVCAAQGGQELLVPRKAKLCPRCHGRSFVSSAFSLPGQEGVRHVPLRRPESTSGFGAPVTAVGFPAAGGSRPKGLAVLPRAGLPRTVWLWSLETGAACLPLGPPVPPWLFRCLSLAVLQGEDPEPVVSLKQSPLCDRLCHGCARACFSRSPVSCPCPAHTRRCPGCFSGCGFLFLVPPCALRLRLLLPSQVHKSPFPWLVPA